MRSKANGRWIELSAEFKEDWTTMFCVLASVCNVDEHDDCMSWITKEEAIVFTTYYAIVFPEETWESYIFISQGEYTTESSHTSFKFWGWRIGHTTQNDLPTPLFQQRLQIMTSTSNSLPCPLNYTSLCTAVRNKGTNSFPGALVGRLLPLFSCSWMFHFLFLTWSWHNHQLGP